MAKEKSGASAVILRTSVTQAGANGFIQGSLLTGLSTGGNDALLVKEVQIEFPSLMAAASAAAVEYEAAVTRATKAAMANILDDDVAFKYKYSAPVNATGTFIEPGLIRYNPVVDMVLIEDMVYFSFDTNNTTGTGTAIINLICVPATVTESEKVGILLSRLN